MKEIFILFVATIFIVLFAVIVNNYANKTKIERCEKVGGTIVLNVSNADITSCIIPRKSK